MTCHCGCNQEADYLITGTDYLGRSYVDDPACRNAALYCEDASRELGLDFVKKPVETVTS